MKILLFALLVVAVVLVGLSLFLIWYRLSKLPKPPFKKPVYQMKPDEWKEDEVTIGWIGHSTVLIHLNGIKIITDPVLGKRVGLHLGLKDWQVGPKRHTAPALSVAEIGKVDLILLSHAHFDHFDMPTLKQLAHPDSKVITARGTSHLLQRLPFGQVNELEGEQKIEILPGLHVQAVPVKHWGNRYPWNTGYGHTGYLIETAHCRLFYPGDTAYTPNFRKLREIGEIDVAFMPIGAYYPDSFQWAHCTPEQAWEMFVDTGARWLVPIHWDTFVLSYEPVHEPIERLFQAAGRDADHIVLHQHGAVFQFSKVHV